MAVVWFGGADLRWLAAFQLPTVTVFAGQFSLFFIFLAPKTQRSNLQPTTLAHTMMCVDFIANKQSNASFLVQRCLALAAAPRKGLQRNILLGVSRAPHAANTHDQPRERKHRNSLARFTARATRRIEGAAGSASASASRCCCGWRRR